MQLVGEASAPVRESAFERGFSLADLAELRRLVAVTALDSGLSARRAGEFALAVNEIAANAVVHGRPPATIRLRRGNGELICDVSDSGGGLEDLLVGQVRPAPDAVGGRGIWLARQLCDGLEIRNGTGCTVTLRAATPR